MVVKNKSFTLFDNLTLTVSEEDWDFMCRNRFGTDRPSEEALQAEFVSGTGITPNKKHLWSEASSRFAEYVGDLREIQKLDINKMARVILKEVVSMTYKEWKEKQRKANELCKAGKITKGEKASFEKVMRLLCGKCLDCRSNDGCPHGECWSCND